MFLDGNPPDNRSDYISSQIKRMFTFRLEEARNHREVVVVLHRHQEVEAALRLEEARNHREEVFHLGEVLHQEEGFHPEAALHPEAASHQEEVSRPEAAFHPVVQALQAVRLLPAGWVRPVVQALQAVREQILYCLPLGTIGYRTERYRRVARAVPVVQVH